MTEQDWDAYEYHRKRGRGWIIAAIVILATLALLALLRSRYQIGKDS